MVSIPQDKIQKAIKQIDRILQNKKRKMTVGAIQKLCGLLNFICRAIYPGRPFLMRLYNSLAGFKQKELKQHHHVRLVIDTIQDLMVWKMFLGTPNAYCRPFMDFDSYLDAEILDWYTDEAKCQGKGYRGHHGQEWFQGVWESHVLELLDPSIEYLELYAVAISILLWADNYRNKRIILFCDNESIVYMINRQSSKCKNCMVLIRMITFQGLISNTRIYARHIKTTENGRADALSRNKEARFFSLSRDSNVEPDKFPQRIPEILSDISRIWIH